jgi:hypothetical protein
VLAVGKQKLIMLVQRLALLLGGVSGCIDLFPKKLDCLSNLIVVAPVAFNPSFKLCPLQSCVRESRSGLLKLTSTALEAVQSAGDMDQVLVKGH